MIILEYLIIAITAGLSITLAWLTILTLVSIVLSNQFDYYHKKAELAMGDKNFVDATIYNERTQRVAKNIQRVEQLLYFRFFS